MRIGRPVPAGGSRCQSAARRAMSSTGGRSICCKCLPVCGSTVAQRPRRRVGLIAGFTPRRWRWCLGLSRPPVPLGRDVIAASRQRRGPVWRYRQC